MKITIDIPKSLLEEVQSLAAKQGRTLREMLIDGLGQILTKRKGPSTFRLRKASFKGTGLQEGAEELWSADRDFSRYPGLKVKNPLV